MKYLSSILIALCLVAAPATFTGCGTTQTKESIVFYTFKDVQTIVHRAMDVFAERVVSGNVSAANQAKVEDAYARYQDSFRVAFAVAQSDPSKLTPLDVQRIADELLRIIYSL